jgi:ferritin-like metal-binding protein YciE
VDGRLPTNAAVARGEAKPEESKDSMPETTVAQEKLIQYLNEAYGLEQRLETSLQAHIAMTAHDGYKRRLKEHLTETKRHGRDVKKRIKQLGGVAATVDAPGPAQVGEAAQAVLSGAQKAAALAQGPLHALRGTGQEEKHLKNAKTEYASEAEEIATYSSIEALAQALGDRDTQQLARVIKREEERMRSYLEKEIPRFTKAVAQAEIPASLRAVAGRTKKAPTRSKPAAGRKPAAGKTAAGRKPAASKKAAAGKKASAARKASTAARKASPRTSPRARTASAASAKAKGSGR